MPALTNRYRWIFRGLMIGGVLFAFGGAAMYFAWAAPRANARQPAAVEMVEPAARLTRLPDNRIRVPGELAKNMRLQTADALAATRSIPLAPLQGCLAYDSNSLARIHSRFPGEVVSVGTTTELAEPSLSSQPATPRVRPLRQGDLVRQGDLLAVVWSKDLGEKKSELVDAVSKLTADERILTTLTELLKQGAAPERSMRDAVRVVQADRVALDRAERTLRSWRLSDEEIAAVRAEAGRLNAVESKRSESSNWARVEIRSAADGVILEKNINLGDIVDTSAVLFQVCDLSHLVVWAHAFEDDLPMLQALPKPLRWAVGVAGRPGVVFPGTLDQIGSVIDPNQHTVLVTGRVENPRGDLKIGQFVTVGISLPPVAGELELPVDAVTEDGRESVVFIQRSDEPTEYIRQTVQVTRRFRDTIMVRAGETGLKAGDRIVTAGSLLLRDAYSQLPKPAE